MAFPDPLSALPQVATAALTFLACAVAFSLLSLCVKGRRALSDGWAAVEQTKINAILLVLDRLAVGPLVGAATVAATETLRRVIHLQTAGVFEWLGFLSTALLVLICGDFLGYWRHRLQHSRWLWSAHAVHHSDTHLTWLSLERMHPVDRLGTALDTIALAFMGFPAWALGLNSLVRHYYGYLIHADLPWTWGKASLVLNSPVMHRWHHARDVAGSGSNFATVLSIWDRMFGTFYQPGPCEAPLGVREDMGRGALGQYLHPFKVWGSALRAKSAGLQSS